MSQQLEKLVSICLHTSIDGTIGTFIAYAINTLFALQEKKDPTPSLVSMIFVSLVQGCLTMVAAEEMRNLLWNNPQDDPTGGVAFIVTLFQQPTLWARVSEIYLTIFSEFMKNSNSNGNPDNKN